MKLTDKELLEYALEILQEWQDDDEISEVTSAFTLIDSVDHTTNKAMLQKIRKALRSNKSLNQSYMKRQLGVRQLADRGHWWWDPEQW